MNLPRAPWRSESGITKTAEQTVNTLKIKVAQIAEQIKQIQDLLEDVVVDKVSTKAVEQKAIEVTNVTPPKQSTSKYRPGKIADITERRLRAKHKQ